MVFLWENEEIRRDTGGRPNVTESLCNIVSPGNIIAWYMFFMFARQLMGMSST